MLYTSPMFLVIPAVDIQQGRVVRLFEGDPERETVYFDRPLDAARHWAGLGAEWLHLVDLDAALGRGNNRAEILEIAGAGLACVEVGGGIRSLEGARDWLPPGGRGGPGAGPPPLPGGGAEVGGGIRSLEVARDWLDRVERVVLGTVATQLPEVVEALVADFGPERVAVSIDAYEGRVAVRGWAEVTEVETVGLAVRMAGLGVRHLIYTDVSRDGTLRGVNAEPVRALRAAFPHTLIAGGGVATDADLDLYEQLGLDGCLVGRALYEGRVHYPRTP